MKLLVTLLGAALAGSVPAQPDGDWAETLDGPNCGSYKNLAGMASINSTCTLSFKYDPDVVQISGAFITGTYTVTGYDGVTVYEDQGVIVEWPMALDDDGNRDNSTCASHTDITFNCVDNGEQTAGVYFQGFANSEVQPLNAQVWAGGHDSGSLTYHFDGDCDAGTDAGSQAIVHDSDLVSIENHNCTHVNVWTSTVTWA